MTVGFAVHILKTVLNDFVPGCHRVFLNQKFPLLLLLLVLLVRLVLVLVLGAVVLALVAGAGGVGGGGGGAVFQPWAKCVTSRQQCTAGCILFTSSKSDVATKYLSRESSLCNRWRYWAWQRHDDSLVQFGCQVCYSKPEA